MKNEEKNEKNDVFEANKLLITAIYQNTRTAIQSINDIISKIKCDSLVKEISNEETNYNIIAQECEVIAKSIDMDLKDNNLFEKMRLWSSVNISTALNKETSHIAEMLLIGTFMGVITCIQNQSEYSNADEELLSLLSKLQKFEENNIENLKTFL